LISCRKVQKQKETDSEIDQLRCQSCEFIGVASQKSWTNFILKSPGCEIKANRWDFFQPHRRGSSADDRNQEAKEKKKAKGTFQTSDEFASMSFSWCGEFCEWTRYSFKEAGGCDQCLKLMRFK
jgi:hypothetical protein